jgi:hypothetical protein
VESTRSINTRLGEFSPDSNSFRTTVISLSRSFLAMKELTIRSASRPIAHAKFSSLAGKVSK